MKKVALVLCVGVLISIGMAVVMVTVNSVSLDTMATLADASNDWRKVSLVIQLIVVMLLWYFMPVIFKKYKKGDALVTDMRNVGTGIVVLLIFLLFA
jgi:hypothetical protein